MPSTQKQYFSVTQITSLIKDVLEGSFRNLTIEGEISNYRPNASGHLYFTLKDDFSQIKAVMFKSSVYSLSFRPKNGDKVRCFGNLSVYTPQGNYQIIISKMEIAGSGNILQMLEQRKQNLAKEGLFNLEKKRNLPLFPKTIGVVTSPTGAAIRDILNITRRRSKNVNVIIFPAIVQGEGAAKTIVKMIEIANFYNLCDVLIVGRGGGSLEDLLPFSDEEVVRAVANSKIPTISAVGHEIDVALCDYAADKRAPTPSAAAEIAIPLQADIKQNIEQKKSDLYQNIKKIIEQKRLLIKTFTPENFEIRFRNIEQPLLNRFDSAKENLYKNFSDKIKNLRIEITNCKTILENSSPQTILERGYSMVTDSNGNVIRNSLSVKVGDDIKIKPSKGEITAKVI